MKDKFEMFIFLQKEKEMDIMGMGEIKTIGIKKEYMTFGEALEAVKKGKLIARNGWNGANNMFVFMRPEHMTNYDDFKNFTSIPDNVKEYYAEGVIIRLSASLCLKANDDSIVIGWLASQADMLADDWFVYERWIRVMDGRGEERIETFTPQ